MTDYEAMYYKLFNKVTDIIDELQKVQVQTEEMYILAAEQLEAAKPNQSQPPAAK